MNKIHTINVLHIASGDLWAGAEVQLFTLARSLDELQDINISVVLLNHGILEQKLLDSNINVIVLDESKLNSIQIFLQLLRTIRKTKPDVIHTHRVKENILGSIAARFRNIPTLRTAHGASEHNPAWYHIPKRSIIFMDWLCGRFLQKKIIAVSKDLAGILQADFPANRIFVIENGIDLASLTAAATSVNDGPVESDMDANTPSFRIGIACRLVPVKRVDLFIRAAAELLDTHPELNTSFHIFGDGPLDNELKALTKQLNHEKKINFEGHCENIHQQLEDLDILLITSDHEGLPMILLEAMSLQTPVIAHAVGGIPTVLNQGQCGVLVSDHQPSAYADAIYTLIKSPKTRASIIYNALSRVTTLYTSRKNAEAYHTIYKKLTN